MSLSAKVEAPVILIADDEEGLREIFAESLKLSGYRVHTAQNGELALKILQREVVDLLLTDILMPDMDGIELIMQVRRMYPQLKVLAMSGGGRTAADVLINIAKRLGVHGTLEKPFDLPALLAQIEGQVGRPVGA
jgi:DNA-binding NtrC family response regulator